MEREEYDKKIKGFKLEKEVFRGKLIKLATELIDDESVEKTPEMVLAIAEVSKVCLEGFNITVEPFSNRLNSSQGLKGKSQGWIL